MTLGLVPTLALVFTAVLDAEVCRSSNISDPWEPQDRDDRGAVPVAAATAAVAAAVDLPCAAHDWRNNQPGKNEPRTASSCV
jgi:hypothetical protein